MRQSARGSGTRQGFSAAKQKRGRFRDGHDGGRISALCGAFGCTIAPRWHGPAAATRGVTSPLLADLVQNGVTSFARSAVGMDDVFALVDFARTVRKGPRRDQPPHAWQRERRHSPTRKEPSGRAGRSRSNTSGRLHSARSVTHSTQHDQNRRRGRLRMSMLQRTVKWARARDGAQPWRHQNDDTSVAGFGGSPGLLQDAQVCQTCARKELGRIRVTGHG